MVDGEQMFGGRVVTVETGDDGRFTIAVPPGTYEVRAGNLAGTATAAAVPVTVAPAAYVDVVMVFSR
jgi:hypothetical protein